MALECKKARGVDLRTYYCGACTAWHLSSFNPFQGGKVEAAAKADDDTTVLRQELQRQKSRLYARRSAIYGLMKSGEMTPERGAAELPEIEEKFNELKRRIKALEGK